MRNFKPKSYGNLGPEAKIQRDIVSFLKCRDWFCKTMIGNAFQFGVPDLFAAHPKFGQKWIEVKNPVSFSFTAAQQIEFPKMHSAGVGIWILFSAEVSEMEKLFKPANWFEVYFKWSHSATKPVKF